MNNLFSLKQNYLIFHSFKNNKFPFSISESEMYNVKPLELDTFSINFVET